MRAFVCAKSAETFPAHRGTSVNRLCTKPRIKHVHPTAVDQTYLSECFGPASGPFDNIINFRARVRVRKECGDVPRTQGNVCAPFVHSKPSYNAACAAERPSFNPISRHDLGHRRGPFDNIVGCLARVRVRKECGDVPRTQGNVCAPFVHTKPSYNAACAAERPSFRPISRHDLGHRRGLFDNIVGCLACVRVRKECAKSALHVSARIERFESVTPGVTLPKR